MMLRSYIEGAAYGENLRRSSRAPASVLLLKPASFAQSLSNGTWSCLFTKGL